MPIPLIPLIQAGAALGSQGINAWTQGRQNKLQRRWNEKMYWLQREHSLQDWQMQADYNSPLNQMKRLKEAGLNPHLVYGQGADAQMGQSPRSAQVENWNPQAPQVDLSSVLGSYLDAQVQQQQLNNLEKQETLLDAEKLKKDWETQEIMSKVPKHQVDTELGRFQLEFKKASMETQLKQLQATLQKTYADTQFTLDENERAKLSNSANLQKTAEEILQIRISRAKTGQEIQNLKQALEILKSEQVVKRMEAEYARRGIRSSDPWYVRGVSELVQRMVRLPWSVVNPFRKVQVQTGRKTGELYKYHK